MKQNYIENNLHAEDLSQNELKVSEILNEHYK